MKIIIIMLLMVSLLVGLVSAGICNEPGFQYCWEDSDSGGDASAKGFKNPNKSFLISSGMM